MGRHRAQNGKLGPDGPTFRGRSIPSAGLESEKRVFERYRAIRKGEREYA
jgi:hypothetical protein